MNRSILVKKWLFSGFAIAAMLFMIIAAATPVSAATKLDITVDDWNIHAIPNFPNVTYTIDGTGSDWWDSGTSAGMGSGVNAPVNQLSLSGLRASIGLEGYTVKTKTMAKPVFYSVAQVTSLKGGAGATETNRTSTEAVTGFEEYTYKTGNYDFKDIEDEDTNVWDKNVTTAAKAFNVTSKYVKLNKTLSTAEEDDDFDNKDYRSGYINMDDAYTFAVGYDDLRAGLGLDLKNILALLHNKDLDDIKIQSWNMSTFHIAYNTTEDWVTKVKGWIDDSFDYASGSTATIEATGILYGTAGARTGGSGASLQAFSVSNFLKDVSSKLRSASISFGTGLKQFSSRTYDWFKGTLSGTGRTVTKAATDLWRTAKGLGKSAISGGQKLAVDLSHKVGKGVNSVLSKGVSIVQSAVGKVLSILGSPLLWILIVIVIIFAIVFGPRIVRAGQRKL